MASNNFSETENAILTTLLYSDIFDFPLTVDELWKFLISGKKITRSAFFDALSKLDTHIGCKDGFYFVQGRDDLVTKRKHHLTEVQKKIKIAKKASFYLAHIPSIRLIAISGGLAMKNVTKDADIDLFIVVQKGTLFVTRFWILCLLEWLGLRRRRKEKHPSDKICVNLLIDEQKLSWPVQKRDIYTAHEIAQLVPLFQRDDMYRRFMDKNSWIRTLLVNSLDEQSVFLHLPKNVDYFSFRFFARFLFASPVERIMQSLQQKYMKRHQTNELVKKHILALHPNDYRSNTLSVLRLKCDKLGLLTNF